MALQDVLNDIEGYQDIVQEREVLMKYGSDMMHLKGVTQRRISSLHPKRILLTVSEVREETFSAKTLRLVAREGILPPFQAGQYINLFADVGGIRTSRPYSISSSPDQTGYYDITIRRVEDGFVSNYFLEEVKPGDKLISSGPSGHFHHNPIFHGDDLVFIAGGSGITPFMSMVQDIADRGLTERRVHLIYGSKDASDIIFHERLQEIADRHLNISYTPVISEPPVVYKGKKGFITAKLLQDLLGDLSPKTFYLCGPEAMYTFCLKELASLGIQKRKIRIEVFGPPKEVALQPGWPEEILPEQRFVVQLKNGKTIYAQAGETLMASLERNGMVIPALCRSGECSLCRTKLLSGKVYHPPGVKLRKSDRDFGYIHPCIAYPLEDLQLMI
ncbi:MAG: 2Fe-2S iron-sulfur cluster binding domain-containing protein [Syntrophaceae bacterium]|jgi:glycine betaine catabolism B|nr:2Fe-2S iron-sulfur cluster binding domain-containing protein [Syntrophaceae bacterium]